jgi:hypothetical protein
LYRRSNGLEGQICDREEVVVVEGEENWSASLVTLGVVWLKTGSNRVVLGIPVLCLFVRGIWSNI